MLEGVKERYHHARRWGRRTLLKLDEREGFPLTPLLVLGISGCGVAVLVATGIGSVGDIGVVVVTGVITALLAGLVGRQKRQHNAVSAITLSYIATGDRDLLDELLGGVITGQFKRGETGPTHQLFDTLETVSTSSNWELQRRLVEALPGLAELNDDRTMTLIQTLRRSWHPTWHGDLRRRAIESLIVPGPNSHVMFITQLEHAEVVDLLALDASDEVWTVLALVEATEHYAALHRAKDRPRAVEAKDALRDDLLGAPRFSADERTVFRAHQDGTAALTAGNLTGALDVAERELGSALDLARASAVRLLGNAARHPRANTVTQRILELMLRAATDPVPNVRRPLAREAAMGFLLDQFGGPWDAGARTLVFDYLLADDDLIIPLTTLDLMSPRRMQSADLEAAANAAEHHPGADDDLRAAAQRVRRGIT